MHICTYLCIYLWSVVAVSFYESCQWPSPSKYSRTVHDPCSCMRAGSRDLPLMDRLQRKAHSLDNDTGFFLARLLLLSHLLDWSQLPHCELPFREGYVSRNWGSEEMNPVNDSDWAGKLILPCFQTCQVCWAFNWDHSFNLIFLPPMARFYSYYLVFSTELSPTGFQLQRCPYWFYSWF